MHAQLSSCQNGAFQTQPCWQLCLGRLAHCQTNRLPSKRRIRYQILIFSYSLEKEAIPPFVNCSKLYSEKTKCNNLIAASDVASRTVVMTKERFIDILSTAHACKSPIRVSSCETRRMAHFYFDRVEGKSVDPYSRSSRSVATVWRSTAIPLSSSLTRDRSAKDTSLRTRASRSGKRPS